MDRDDPGYAGWRDYTPLLLNLYDPLVIGPVARFVWRSPGDQLLRAYREHVREPHLDVGPGTGWFIEKSGLPDGGRVTIVDPNPNVLRHAARRLARLDVTAVQADVLKPLPLPPMFNSAALHLVIHCLPGPMSRKQAAVANVAAVLAPDGILFGASVLGESGPHSWLARRVLHAFNRRRAFDNLGDSEDSLRQILESSFDDVELGRIGSIATFVARRPRPAAA
jgi:SAM-dependent methyltransferase